MSQRVITITALVLAVFMAAALAVGCGPEQPEYNQPPRRQPQQWPSQEDDSSQQQAPSQSQGGDVEPSQSLPRLTN